MRLPRLSHFATKVAKTPAHEEHAALQPFRLLDLPKEIRLMIYKNLCHIETKEYHIPLRDPEHFASIQNPSVIGISILAACRTINSEATPIFKKAFAHLQMLPLIMTVKAEHLTSLCSARFGFTCNNWSILDFILIGMAHQPVLEGIHEYRAGKGPISSKKNMMACEKNLHFRDNESAIGLMTFILRGAKALEMAKLHKDTEPPRITIHIDTPYTHQPSIYTLRFSLSMILYHTCKGRIIPRRLDVLGTLEWFVNRFASEITAKCLDYPNSMRFSAMLRYVGELPDGAQAAISESGFAQAISDGNDDWPDAGASKLSYGGVLKSDDGGEE